MSAAGSSEGDRQAYALRVFTLGRFALEVNSKALRFSGKTQRKPLQLIKALVALGGESAPVGPLTESLWPDSEGDRAYRAFTSTLFHLRKLVGQGLLLLQDGRLSLDADACWVDAREFTRLLTEAERAVAGGHGAEASPLLDRALELYRGPFLDGEFDPPEVLSARERLHGMFLRNIELLGQYFQDT